MSSGNNKLNHVGIIMDGNRRWAKKHLLSSFDGHKQGVENFKEIARYSNKIGIKNLTVYAFSTENWRRTQEEVNYLLNLFEKYLTGVLEEFDIENVKIRFIGDMSKFSQKIQDLILQIEQKSCQNTGMILNIAVNYGSREEICSAIKKISSQEFNNNITEKEISNNILSPDLDLVIRTGGEKRLSNFMLWQSAYAELYFTDILWPDFTVHDLEDALKDYSKRTRKFGGD
ncbi:MAG: di-trans,poly-cis-decaprenylcistransferase [Clostridia bacterium]|nr:di-trans,poly-cis-decaprenylcistransferase [Clostridia bacterium]